MAAGLGFKDFTTGEVLTAADVDGYLMQGVWVFADAAARDAAVTSPQEGNFAYLKDTNVTTYYTGSAWTALDTQGIPASAFTAKGDLLVGTGSGTYDDLTVGTNGYTLVADSSTSTGLKWAAPAGGGKVLQVVQGTLTSNFSTSSASLVDTGLTVSITPSAATSKIYVAANLPEIEALNTASATGVGIGLALLRGATKLQDGLFGIFGQASSSNKEIYSNLSFSYLDSPATTSSTTYKVQAVLNTGTTAYVNASATKIASIIVFEIGA